LPGWDTFTVVLGGAPGALIGLLFVSVSIRIDVIAASPEFRNRGAATLSHFGAMLLLSLLLAVAGQHEWQIGLELIVLAAVLRGSLYWLDRRGAAGRSTQAISNVLRV
jgi:hypothetical protein